MGRKLRRTKLQKKREKPHRGRCTVAKKCKHRGGEIFHCITCEQLRDAGKKTDAEVFRIQTCVAHRDKAIAKIKTHALVKHPVNILKVTIAGLKGEL
jgi:hypothetical protein